MSWGSTQYDTAEEFFYMLQEKRPQFKSMQEMFESLDIKLTVGTLPEFPLPLAKILDEEDLEELYEETTRRDKEIRQWEDYLQGGHHIWYPEEAPSWFNKYSNLDKKRYVKSCIQQDKEFIRTIPVDSFNNLDEIMDFLRDQSWDLWGAAPHVCQAFGWKIENAPISEGFGPPLNVAIQSGNYETGSYCYILYELGATEEAFTGFDT